MWMLLENFHFVRPWGLLLLPLGLIVWWSWSRQRDPLRGWRAQMDPALLEALVVRRPSSSPARGRATLFAWLVAGLAIAGPTWRLEPNPFAEDAAPLVIVLKADMGQTERPQNPTSMERAQMKVTDLAAERAGQALGLIAYAGSAHLVLPPTKDTQAVSLMAGEISAEIMPVSGDRLDLALAEAQRSLDSWEQAGSIVVFADTVGCDLQLLERWRKSHSTAVQILSIQAPVAGVAPSLRAAGQVLKASVEPWDAEGKDIAAIVRRGNKPTKFQRGQQQGQWQEAGWWLVPWVGLGLLLRFRAERSGASR